MHSENIRNNPYITNVDDGTADSLEYKILEKNVLQRANAYQNYLNLVCKSHTDYSSPDISQAKQECINQILDKLAPIIKNVEHYYDFVHSSKFNVVGFVDYLKMIDKEEKKIWAERDDRSMRFGRNSFFEKYRSFMH